jgi:C1A family cysteine protease
MKYAWIPELPDKRAYAFVPKTTTGLPKHVDLRDKLPPVWDQLHIGSCVAHAVAAAHIVAQKRDRTKAIMPSRLALYYSARAIRGWQRQDSGCYITDACKVAVKLGVAEEKLYPYKTSRVFLKPPASVEANALKHQAVEYQKLDSTNPKVLMAALAEGHVIAFGSVLYENHTELVNNVMPDPDLSTKMIGGHAMALVGYDLPSKTFLVRNSWGPQWGDNGHHAMSFKYITDRSLTDDVWIIKKVEA